MRIVLVWLLMATTMALTACGGSGSGPEDRIRVLLEKIEHTAEQRQALGFKDYISEDYSDGNGRRRNDVLRLMAGTILRNKSIHLLVHVAEVQVAEDGNSGTARVFVAMAASPVAAPDQLGALQADLYRFDLRFRTDSDGEFQVVSGAWQRARRSDFFSGDDDGASN